MYLQGGIQGLGDVEFLQLFVVFGQMALHWFADKKVILRRKRFDFRSLARYPFN